MKRSNSETILADPLSRTYEDWKGDWLERAANWNVPPEGPTVVVDWMGLWNDVKRLEAD